MKTLPLSKEEWYLLRDDRTGRIEGARGFHKFSVGVIVDDTVRSSYSLQVLALTTINILARWCRRITVEITPAATSLLTSTKGTSFRQLIEKQVSSADPYNDFSFGNVTESAHNRILVIGSANRSFAHPQVYVNAAGWIAGVRLGKEPLVLPLSREQNPVGPGFAACIVAAELFRSACGNTTPGAYTNWYSLLDHSRFDDFPSLDHDFSTCNLNLGRVYQIGCGAVGSSLDFFLSLDRKSVV